VSANILTPKGVAVYPNIDRPDRKYGNYKCDLLMDPKEASAIKRTLMEEVAKVHGKAKAKSAEYKCFKKDEETGKILVRATSKYPPAVFDIKGGMVFHPEKKPGGKVPPVAGGSVLRMRVGAAAYKNDPGGKLYLNAVQLITLQTYNSGGFDSAEDALGDDEDGYVAGEETEGTETDDFDDEDSDDFDSIEEDDTDEDAGEEDGDDPTDF
jgi:hypothetical protein